MLKLGRIVFYRDISTSDTQTVLSVLTNLMIRTIDSANQNRMEANHFI